MASSSATVAVEKATSDLLLGPDWTMNIEICDSINSHQWQSKDVVKAVKKRLQHKSSKVQLLALTLLETMVKNCGDFVHFQIAERNILEEMIKIVRKKADMQVRDKILVLLDSWQEAFGGAAGKYPQYYWAYEELRRSGVVFPKRSPDAAPIFTPPPTHATLRHMQTGYGMPNNSLKRLDETISTQTESLSLSNLDSMRHVMEVLGDMLQALNPSDDEALKDEVIVDLAERCRTNQKKLMQMLTTTGDEELLGRGLELNDSIQSLLARHDAIASGTPLPTQDASSSSQSTEAGSSSFNANEVRGSSPKNSGPTRKDPSAPLSSVTRGQIEEKEEEEDEFAQLARRHSKTQTVHPKDATTGSSEGSISMNTSNVPEPSAAIPSNALAVVNPTAPVNTSKEQDIIDLLSITLSTSSVSPETQQTVAAEEMHQASVPSSSEGYPYASQTYSGHSSYNTYVVPWAQQPQNIQSQPQPQAHLQNQHLRYSVPQQQPQTQPQPVNVLQPQVQSPVQNQHLQYSAPQPESHLRNQQDLQYSSPEQQLQPHEPQQFQSQVQSRPQPQQQLHNQHLQYPSTYPPPPWAATPGYPTNQNQNMSSTPQTNATVASHTPAHGVRPLQQNNAFPSGGDPQWNSGARNPASATGQKPFIPSYRLFEDLNVFGNTDGRIKMSNSGTSSSLSGTMGPGMVGGRK